VRWLQRLTTAVVTIGVVLALVLLLRSKMPATQVGGKCTAWALFRDASRLAVGSPVKIAGVQVGEISHLTVSGAFARVEMDLQDGLDFPADAWITKRAESAFGDSYLEIIPTIAEGGAPSGRRFACGDQIVHVQEGSSTDSVLRSIARTMPKVDEALDTIHQFALDGRKWASGPLQDGIRGVDQWIAEGHIDKPVASAHDAMDGFERGTQRAADAVHGVDAAATLDRYNRGVLRARAQIKDFKAQLGSAMTSARDGMDRIDPTVHDIEDVVVAINEGSGEDWKGTLGNLLNKPDVANQIGDVTDGLAESSANLVKFHSWLGARFEWYLYTGIPRAYATAELRARNDKFYLLEFERGPLGEVPRDQIADVLNNPQYTRSQEIQDGIRFTLEFGKTFGHVQLRGGVKESTPGVGADLLLRDGKLRLSSDVFGSFFPTPRLKLTAALEVFSGIYILGGVDDALNSPGYLRIEKGNTPVPTLFDRVRYGRDYFVGATLQFTDADLATLIRVYGALIVGLLIGK
jgi:phospholipid/cholesterol/gamma-HCH transport system substrate-binding protein